MAAAKITTIATGDLAKALNIFQGFNWAQLSDLVEGKDTLQEGVTTAEELANTLAEGATVVGAAIPGLAAPVAAATVALPIAEQFINFVIGFLPAATGIAGSKASNAPTILAGR